MTDRSAPTRGEVTQGDREAAAEILKFAGMWSLARKVRQGKADDNLTVDLVAAHRLAAIEGCAKVADGYGSKDWLKPADGWSDDVKNWWKIGGTDHANAISSAIRNLGRGV